MNKFWLTFVIHEAMAVVSAFVGSSKLNEAQKAAATALIQASQGFLATL